MSWTRDSDFTKKKKNEKGKKVAGKRKGISSNLIYEDCVAVWAHSMTNV